MIKRWFSFFSKDLWNFPLSTLRGWRCFFCKVLRVLDLSIRGFKKDRGSLHASSLTFFSMMSIVPLLAVVFAIAKGFGVYENLEGELYKLLPEHRPLLEELLKFSQKMILEVKGGLIGGYGFVILFWSVARLFSNMEISFNRIWKVQKARSLKRVVSDYFALMLLGPVLYLLASSLVVFIAVKMEMFFKGLLVGTFALPSIIFLIRLIPYALFWVLYTFLFLFLPNIKVRFRAALWAGLVSSIFYVILQKFYIYFQIGLSRYGAIYGSFAALPLFLIWLQLSWSLLFYGGELSFAIQHLETKEFEKKASEASLKTQKFLTLFLLQQIISGFEKENPPLSEEGFLKEYGIPSSLFARGIHFLQECQFVYKNKEGEYLLLKDMKELKVVDVLKLFEEKGEPLASFSTLKLDKMAPLIETLKKLDSALEESDANIRVKDLPLSV